MHKYFCLTFVLLASIISVAAQERTEIDCGGIAILKKDSVHNQYSAAAAAVRKHPEVMKRIFLWEGSEYNGYVSVFDSFADGEAAFSSIAMAEALDAEKFLAEGKKTYEIQLLIDKRYARFYPFAERSEQLKRYLATLASKDRLDIENRIGGKTIWKD